MAREARVLESLSDQVLLHRLITEEAILLLPGEWWPEEQPPTRWGWWVQVRGCEDGKVRCTYLERQAIMEPPVVLPISGVGSVRSTLACCTPTAIVTSRSLVDMGCSLDPPCYPEAEQPLPRQVATYLRIQGRWGLEVMSVTRNAGVLWRNLRGAVHVNDRPVRIYRTQVVPPEGQVRADVIADPVLLLAHHIQRFKAARWTTTKVRRSAWYREGRGQVRGGQLHELNTAAPICQLKVS